MASFILDVDQLSVQKTGFSTSLVYGSNFNLNLFLVKSGIAFSANAADTVTIVLYVPNQRISGGAVQNLCVTGAPTLLVLSGINYLQVNVSLLTSQLASLVQTNSSTIACAMHVTYTQADGEVYPITPDIALTVAPNLTLSTAGTVSQAPAGYPAPGNVNVYSPIINGDFSVNQRLNTLSALGNSSVIYAQDKWKIQTSALSARFTVATVQPTTEATLPWVTPNWSATSTSSFTVQTAQASPAAGDFLTFSQFIESALWTPFLNGSLSVSFLANTNSAQVLTFFLQDSALAYNFCIPFTLIGDGSWHYYSSSILQPPALGTWAINSGTNAFSAKVGFCLLSGSTYTAVGNNQWNTTGGDLAAIGQGNFMNSLTNTLQITQVAISPGMFAQPWGQIAPPNNLSLCKRYYRKSYPIGTVPQTVTSSGQMLISIGATMSAAAGGPVMWDTPPMRASAAPLVYSPSSGTLNKAYDLNTAADVTITGATQWTEGGFTGISASTTLVVGHVYETHWIQDLDY